jgi:lipopolysaccharide export LptBFGC system permease protein LptF
MNPLRFGRQTVPVDRNTVLWALVLFFGASVLFGSLRRATENSPAAVTVAVQLTALALVIGGVVLFMRRRR